MVHTVHDAHAIVPEASLKEIYDALQWEVQHSKGNVDQLVRNGEKWMYIQKR